MSSFAIAVIPGDGVGPEVIEAGRRVLARAAELFELELAFTELPWGSQYYFQHGRMMPADALELLQSFDAIYLGAVGHPDIPDHITLNGLLLPIRRGFDLYVNLRPAILYEGVSSPLQGRQAGDIDLVIVRENTEGEYAPVGGFLYHQQPEEVALQTAVFTRRGIERVVRFAFQLAMNRRHRLASITKSNAQAFGMVLWDRVFQAVAREFHHVETESLLVDAATMHLVRRPETFDVIVASNLFGDILSDLAAVLTGSIGSQPALPFLVRTGARLGSGYRRQRVGQSDRSHSGRCHDARAPRCNRRRRSRPARRTRRAGRRPGAHGGLGWKRLHR